MNGSVIRLDGVPHACIFKLLPEGCCFGCFFFLSHLTICSQLQLPAPRIAFHRHVVEKTKSILPTPVLIYILEEAFYKVWAINTDHSRIENIIYCHFIFADWHWSAVPEKNSMNALHCVSETQTNHIHAVRTTLHNTLLSWAPIEKLS